MNIIRNFFSTILSSILVIIVSLLIITLSITLVIFDSKFILGTLERNNTYEKLATEVVPSTLVYMTTQRFQEANPDKDIGGRVSQEIKKEEFKPLSTDIKLVFETSYSYLIGEKNQFEIKINLGQYIPILDKNLTIALNQLQAAGELQGIDTAELSQNFAEADSAVLLITQEKLEIQGISELSNQDSQTNEKSFLGKARDMIDKLVQTQVLLLISTVVLVALLFASRIPHWHSGFKWLATAAISASFFPLIAGFVLFLTKPIGLITRFINEQTTITSVKPAIDLFGINLNTITEKVFVNLVIFSGVLMLFGISATVLLFFLKNKAAKPK